MTDDNLHTPEGWHIVRLEAEIERLRAVITNAYGACEDSDYDDAGAVLWEALNKPPEQPSPETKEEAG